jgi:hypothetical protein
VPGKLGGDLRRRLKAFPFGGSSAGVLNCAGAEKAADLLFSENFATRCGSLMTAMWSRRCTFGFRIGSQRPFNDTLRQRRVIDNKAPLHSIENAALCPFPTTSEAAQVLQQCRMSLAGLAFQR